MKSFKHFLFLFTFSAFAASLLAQGRGHSKSKFLRRIQKNVWTVGVSGVVIDDDGNAFKKHFHVIDTWNLLPFPTSAKLEGFISNGFSAEACLSYMRLKKGKILGKNLERPHHSNLLTFDANAKYDLNELIGDTKAFSPYVIGGLGYTYRAETLRKHAVTGNFGFGFNIWIYKGWGLNAQTLAKFAINKASGRNYLQHTLGVVYRFNLLTGYRTPNRLGHRYNLFRNR